MRIAALTGAFTGAMALAAAGAAAQESTNRVAAETDWAVFVEDDPKECWSVSAPKETVNTRDGRTVSVRRGDIMLYVTFRPEQGVDAELSFTGGYPFAEDSTVSIEVDDTEYELFTSGEWAWPASESDDARIVTALKAGTTAVLTGRSSRGTTTKDTFSLLGFTAALGEAESRCEG